LDSDGDARPELGDDENAYDKRAPEPHIVTVMSKLDLHLVCLPRHDRPGYPHRFLACGSCQKGLEPQEAVAHAAGATTNGGHGINIPLVQRKALREWIEKAPDLHSAQNMPPLPNQHGNPVPFLKENKGYKCNHCTFCSTVERVMGEHTGTVPGHPTARNVTLQHFFHNRLLFAVQPNRHNKARGDEEGVDLYSLYAKEYGLDVEDESTTSIPFYSDEKEMPVMLQITRWFDHVWRFLRNSDDDEDTDGEDEEIERRDTNNVGEEDDVGEVEHEDIKEKNRDEGDEEMECSRDDSDVEMNNPDSVGMRDNDIESESDSESEVQTSRKRHRPQTMLGSSKRHKKSAVISGALDFIVDRESNSDFDPDAALESEFSEDEEDEDSDSA
jgi:hypothetical protein